MPDFAERLRQLRTKKDVTQVELGRLLNLSKQTISSYENRGSTPDPETLQRLADYFDVSVDYLLGRTDDPHMYGRRAEEDVPVSNSAVIEKRNEKGEVAEVRVATEAAHRTDGYDDELPEEARKALEEYKEFLRQKYKKR